ncbi:hypothetical protein HMPREF3213_01871 [Heyndrickxia coagulans]|uniref:Uncharacterized protein n=1 Tax=Heyndrickxia coagulans TaxID=1398 RepID=A0A133KQL3_HEYCO|nr:hypothetical protein HMPREF3213_01871 [Heyndrickxia coagulans]
MDETVEKGFEFCGTDDMIYCKYALLSGWWFFLNAIMPGVRGGFL